MPTPFGRCFLTLCTATALTICGTTFAASSPWPTKPLTVIVPLPPGGPVDAVAREFAKHLHKELGQPVVVENIAGAYGQIGLTRLHRASADGYTLGIAASGMMVFTPLLEKELPYNTITGFTPISLMSEYANVLVAHPSVPGKSLDELIGYAKANPGKVTYASSGFGSSNHLSGELLNQKTGANLLHVPYKGTAPGRSDVIAGHVTMMFDVVSSSMPFIESGQLKAIATTSKSRNSALPNVPTVSETFADYEVTGWFALFAPPKLPESVQTPLAAAVKKALDAQDFKDFLRRTGYDPASSTPAQLEARIRSDFEYWKPVVDSAAIAPAGTK
jgi:tripartite-type tricarboxylate transporter receptor subunit TctC